MLIVLILENYRKQHMALHYLLISTEDIAAIEAAGLATLAAQMRADVADIDSPEADMCRQLAQDNENFTPESAGPVSYCEDGKAWVMTWELVDQPA